MIPHLILRGCTMTTTNLLFAAAAIIFPAMVYVTHGEITTWAFFVEVAIGVGLFTDWRLF